MSNRTKPVTYRELTSYFGPLALQVFSQGITHNLVAVVASRGPDGALGFAGVSQAFRIVFILGSFVSGFLTAGMVYCTSRKNKTQYVRVTLMVIAAVALVQGILSLPPVSRLLFDRLMGLPPVISGHARNALPACIPLQILFALRIPAFAILFLHKDTMRAYLATFARICMTLLFAWWAVRNGFVGPVWAVACMTVPVVIELVGLHWFARRHTKNLVDESGPVPRMTAIVGFAFSFSIGKVLVSSSDGMLAGIIARAPNPERVLTAYSVSMVLVGPIAYSATRMQAMVVSFRDAQKRKLHLFIVVAGLILGCIPMAAHLPGIAEFWWIGMQRLPADDLGIVALTMVGLIPFPLLVGLRSYAEGRAAVRKRPVAVLGGESMYLTMIMGAGLAFLALGVPGYLIGPLSLACGNITAWAATLLILYQEAAVARIRRIPFLSLREN